MNSSTGASVEAMQSVSTPDRVDSRLGMQTVPGKGWWTVLRLYNPLQPFFDKTWRPSEIEAVD